MPSYSQDLRDRVLRACQRGDRPADIATRFEVSKIWVYKVWQRYRATGNSESLPVGGYRRSVLEGYDEILKEWIHEQPDLTLAEICLKLKEQHGIQIGQSSLWYRLKRLGFTFKKNAGRSRAGRSRN